jgi:hypothetical protein
MRMTQTGRAPCAEGEPGQVGAFVLETSLNGWGPSRRRLATSEKTDMNTEALVS